MAAAQQSIAPPAHISRMKLTEVKGGRMEVPLRLLIHGVDGVGKSTFAVSAPKPILLGTEDGTEHLDVKRFPVPEGGMTWQDVLDAVRELRQASHGYETLVFDSLDWAEPLLWAHVCRTAGVATIEEVGGGYGKGFTAALDGWRVLINEIEQLQRAKGMHFIAIAHSFIKPFKNPLGEDFDRYILKLNEKAAGLLREWSKGVYFANYETFAVKDKAKRVRGVSTGARLMYTQRTAAYDAKDHYGLPEQLALSWDEFTKARASGQVAAPADLRAEILRKAKDLGADIEKVVAETVAQAGDDTVRLSELNNRVNVRLAERAEKGN